MQPELVNASLKEPKISKIEAQMKPGFSKYLENYYLNWQLKNGRASIREFSRWLDINHAQVIQWMNGRGKPGSKNLAKLALKLGPEVYEILGIPPPPEFIQHLQVIYDDLDPGQQEQLKKRIKELISEYMSYKDRDLQD